MKNREEAQFAQWKKARLMEGFLDGEEQKPASSEEVAAEEETKDTENTEGEAKSEEPAEGKPAETSEEDTDISDEGGEAANEDDGLDDDFEGETAEETGTTSGDPEVAELKDAIATLTTQIQALTDQMMKANGEDTGEKAEGDEAPAEENTEEVPEENSEESSEENTEEAPAEGEEKTEEAPAEGEENTEEAPADETKSEAYNFYCRKGKILSENSGYMISVLNEGRYDKLEENIMAVVKAKIRQRIEAAKTKLRTEAFNKKFGE